MPFDKKEEKERFEKFLIIMDDQIDNLKEEAKQHGISLDDTLSDLEKLEELFDLMSKEIPINEKDGLVVFLARHLGEVVRLNCGGRWFIQLEDDKNVNFNEPVIIEHCPTEGQDFAPISVMRSYSLRRKKGTLRRALQADIDPEIINLSNLIED